VKNSQVRATSRTRRFPNAREKKV